MQADEVAAAAEPRGRERRVEADRVVVGALGQASACSAERQVDPSAVLEHRPHDLAIPVDRLLERPDRRSEQVLQN
jgi:hypothetical protein